MLSPQISQELVSTLALRARANRSSILFDNAASLLATQLGLNTAQALSAKETAALERSEWLDQQVINFLTQFPTAIGVELNAGVSTRFHRISNALEWPRFRWADVNTPETHAFNQSLLPITDNYRSLGCDVYQHDWLFRAGWQPGQPLLIIVESPPAHEAGELAQLLTTLCQRVMACSSPLCIVSTYKVCGNAALLSGLNEPKSETIVSFEKSWARATISKLLEQLGIRSPFTQWRGHCVKA